MKVYESLELAIILVSSRMTCVFSFETLLEPLYMDIPTKLVSLSFSYLRPGPARRDFLMIGGKLNRDVHPVVIILDFTTKPLRAALQHYSRLFNIIVKPLSYGIYLRRKAALRIASLFFLSF